jgi:hypothetical protein
MWTALQANRTSAKGSMQDIGLCVWKVTSWQWPNQVETRWGLDNKSLIWLLLYFGGIGLRLWCIHFVSFDTNILSSELPISLRTSSVCLASSHLLTDMIPPLQHLMYQFVSLSSDIAHIVRRFSFIWGSWNKMPRRIINCYRCSEEFPVSIFRVVRLPWRWTQSLCGKHFHSHIDHVSRYSYNRSITRHPIRPTMH